MKSQFELQIFTFELALLLEVLQLEVQACCLDARSIIEAANLQPSSNQPPVDANDAPSIYQR